MAKKRKDDYTIEELVDMEVFTIGEAQAYVEEKTGIKKSTFFDTIRPELNPRPLVRNYRYQRPSHLVVLKTEVDKVIARHKRKLLDD